MRRCAAAGLASLCLAFMLASCAAQDVPASDAPSGTAPAAAASTAALPFPVGRLSAAEWHGAIDDAMGCNDGEAYYELAQASVNVDGTGSWNTDWMILRTDYATLVQSPLCSLPGCAHGDASCPAYVHTESTDAELYLTGIGGRLYLLQNPWERTIEYGTGKETVNVWVERVSVDGTGRERLTDLPGDWVLSEPFPVTDGAALYGQYIDGQDLSFHGVRVDLETGEYTTFRLGLDACERIIGAADGRFVLKRMDRAIPYAAYPNVMEMERQNLLQSTTGSGEPSSLILFDPATGARTDQAALLAQCGLGNVPYITFVEQEKLYYMEADFQTEQRVWQLDLARGTCRLLASFAPPETTGWRMLEKITLFPQGSGLPEPYIQGSYWDEGTTDFLIDVRDGSTREIGLRGNSRFEGSYSAAPRAQTNEGLWLVPIGELDTTWGRIRCSYGVAEPETVFTGAGEVRPVQMWTPPQALG